MPLKAYQSIQKAAVCVLVVALAAGFVACLSPAQQKARDGDAYLSKKDWNGAIVSYLQAANLDPQLKLGERIARAYVGRGDETYNQHDYSSAVFNYEKALSFNPDIDVRPKLGNAKYEVGVADLNRQKYQDAIQEFTGAISGGYAGKDVYLKRASAYNATGLYSAAIGDSSIYLDGNAQSAEAYGTRGYANFKSGEYSKAVSDLSRAIALDPSAKDAYFNRGLTWKSTGNFAQAVLDLKKVIELDPQSAAACVWLGRTYFAQMDYYAAIDQFSRAIELDHTGAAVAYNDRAVCLGKVGRFSDGVADLDTLTGMAPLFYLAYYNRGVLFMKMVQPNPAIEQLDLYLCLDKLDEFKCNDLADGWRGYYSEYTICCIDPGIGDLAAGECNRILSAGYVPEELAYTEGALYFQSEITFP